MEEVVSLIPMAKIVAISISEEKGTKKKPIAEGFFRENYGLCGDAHAEFGIKRQVSLLALESIKKMRGLGLDVSPGDFAENLTTEGIELASLPVGTKLKIGEELTLEISRIGKECHTGCAIFCQVGKCIMPKEGVFARVLKEGRVKPGDEIRVLEE